MDKKHLIIVGVISIIWLIGAVGFYHQTEDLKVLFLAINAFAVVIATYINLISSLQKIKFDKTENTFEYIERWDSALLKEARDFTRELKKEKHKLSEEEILKKIDENKGLERSVITIFNFWQELYLSMIHGRVNGDLLKRSFANIYIDMFERFKPWIYKHKDYDPKGTEDLEKLYKNWQ